MRGTTIEKLEIAIEEIRSHYNASVLTRQQILHFQQNRPEVYIPASFHHMCKAEQRGMYDLDLFNKSAISSGHGNMAIASKKEETDEEILARINTRFEVMDMMVSAAIQGKCRSMIVSGSAGVGKSYTVMNAVRNMPEERVAMITGKVTPTGLFRTLWKHRFDNHVIVFDDTDSVFDNETSMNLLKAACDSSDDRYISWESNKNQIDENGEEIPYTFEFNGSIIFLTNKDFKEMVAKDNAMSPHFSAMMSRSHYIDLSIRTIRELMLRIKWVAKNTSMMEEYQTEIRDQIVEFVDMNKNAMNELSLRVLKKIAETTVAYPDDWKKIVSVTCMK